MELQIRNPESTEPSCEHVSTSGSSDELKGSGDAITNHEVWSKVCINTKAFFRALGLNIIVSAFKFLRHPMGKGFEEPTKTAISQNRITALLRALIHVIPVGVALWEITLNFYTYYVGSFIYNLVYYQFAAKAHEIMIQASLAAIVFSYVRHEMVLGKGLPFGALFSGLQINQISYLWSMEFWGSVGSKHLRIWRKMAMVSLITICFILAAAAGPSSAILLIPRLDYWQAGSTHIFINATPSEIWPDRLDASSVPPRCAFTQEYSFSKDCPSSEWPFLQTFLSFAQDSIPGDLRKASTELRNISLPYAYELTSKNSFRQYQASAFIVLYEWAAKNSSDQTWLSSSAISTVQQATIADAFQTTATVWDRAIRMGNSGGHHGSPFSDQQNAVHRITNDYFQPYSMAYCVRDAIEGSADYRPIAFPISPGFNYNVSDGVSKYGANASIYGNPAIEYPSIVRAQLLELSGAGVHHMVKWVELPKDVFLGSTIGVIILLPQLPAQLSGEITATDIVVCNVGAGWGPSSMNITTSRGGTGAVSSTINMDPEYLANQRKQFAERLGPEQMRDFVGLYQTKSLTTLYKIPIYPSKPVQASQEWAEYLNPFVPALNTTVIDVLMKDLLPNRSKKSRPEVLAQLILTGLITNGMARTAFTGRLQGSVTLTEGAENATEELDGNLWLTGKEDFFKVDPDKSKDWVKLQVDSNIEGYAYNTRGPGPKVAISFLLAYCVLALTHLAYSGISGVSSTCWDSIAEVTALAVNSSPTVMLRNTCAGITEMRIFKIPVRILAVGDEEGEGEHLELMFGNVDEEVENKTIKPNRKYGTMPALKPASSKPHLKTQ